MTFTFSRDCIRGYTLVELIITLAILVIVTTLVAPSFIQIQINQQSRIIANNLVASIQLARSEAIRANTAVILCPRSTNTSCGDDWSHGWIIFRNNNAELALDEEDEIINVLEGSNEGGRLTYRSFANRPFIRINQFGRTSIFNGTFTYCPKFFATSYARQVVINRLGRPRIAQRQNSSGEVLDWRQNQLACLP